MLINGRLLEQTMHYFLLLRLFSKWELLLKEIFSPRRSEVFPLRAVPYGIIKSLLPAWVTSLECCYFYYARA